MSAPLKIYTDARLGPEAKQLLQEGVAPHQLVFPLKPGESVLQQSVAGPEFAGVDIAFGQPDVADIEDAPRLRWVHLTTAGYTRYDTPQFRAMATRSGIALSNSSTVYAESCAEHALAFMLAQARQLPQGLRTRCANGAPEWNRLRQESSRLTGQAVLILGYGVIGARLAELLAPFRMRITAMRRQPRGDEGMPTVTPDELPTAMAAADHVINILPENAASLRFINHQRISWMKPGAIFHNIGRGTTVDQRALADALHSGHLGAAWLDVTDPEPLPDDHPLWSAPNCHITPHTAGGHTNESLTLVRQFLENFRRFQSGEPLLDRIL
jgi:phosphoglycerate dehydrogenase-like enzyme